MSAAVIRAADGQVGGKRDRSAAASTEPSFFWLLGRWLRHHFARLRCPQSLHTAAQILGVGGPGTKPALQWLGGNGGGDGSTAAKNSSSPDCAPYFG